MGKVLVDDRTVEYSDEWSFKNFSNLDLHHLIRLHDVVIYESSFYWERPDSEPFPSWATGITFVKCNLDNIVIPPDAIVIDCTTRRFEVQNDLRDWEIDENGDPIKVMGEKAWIKQGYSVDPADIPDEPLESIDDLLRVGE